MITHVEELLRLINEESRKRGVTTELFLADLLAQRLDPKDRVDIYLKIHEELLKHSDEEYVKGDLVQASEKLWGRGGCFTERYS